MPCPNEGVYLLHQGCIPMRNPSIRHQHQRALDMNVSIVFYILHVPSNPDVGWCIGYLMLFKHQDIHASGLKPNAKLALLSPRLSFFAFTSVYLINNLDNSQFEHVMHSELENVFKTKSVNFILTMSHVNNGNTFVDCKDAQNF